LDVARANGEKLGLDVVWKLGHWWDAVGQQRFDLAVSNPPYIAEGDEHLDALGHEPLSALTAGLDGLDDIRRIVADATQHLQHGHDQAGAVADLLASAGFVAVQSRTDLAGIARCTGAHTPR
jgi:release factor glutamine methyltransferase